MPFKIFVEIPSFGKINHKLSDILESKAVAKGTRAAPTNQHVFRGCMGELACSPLTEYDGWYLIFIRSVDAW
ncbi:MAG: hypothetical protein DRQ49_14660 [Gammaproteobacteria bacterium]|nr:MAG: hypothetical protein DRQ49_14660 [Gammaproteobacteria bacterium]RKZ75647.1 MAG: hypothetical protein DRQ57_06820 [Gammaproteobacteria bacterium]